MKLPLLIIITACFIDAFAQHRVVAYVGSFDDVQITYDVHGITATQAVSTLPAIVLVHGWSCDRTYWSEQTSVLAKKYKVVNIDLAGHGGSGTGRKVYTMESFGEDVAAVVNKLQLQKVILAGHSMGGDVIAEAARILQGRVSGLIMVDAYKKIGNGRSPEEVNAIVSRVREHFRDSTKVLVRSMFIPTSNPALVERVADDMSSAKAAIAISAMEHALSYSRQMPQTLLDLKLPVIAINPDNSPTDVASMKKHGVEVVIIKGVGHFPMMEDPANFNPILLSAIQKLSR
jgi:pimeloyl-ACP methyl ester carboxylesterase